MWFTLTIADIKGSSGILCLVVGQLKWSNMNYPKICHGKRGTVWSLIIYPYGITDALRQLLPLIDNLLLITAGNNLVGGETQVFFKTEESGILIF